VLAVSAQGLSDRPPLHDPAGASRVLGEARAALSRPDWQGSGKLELAT
jgi:hypothetical protein